MHLEKAVAIKWKNENTEAVWDIKHGDSYTH